MCRVDDRGVAPWHRGLDGEAIQARFRPKPGLMHHHRPRRPVRGQALSGRAPTRRPAAEHEPTRQLLRQRVHGIDASEPSRRRWRLPSMSVRSRHRARTVAEYGELLPLRPQTLVARLPQSPHPVHPTHDATEISTRPVRQTPASTSRYLWGLYSFGHLPVDVIIHLYQRFVRGSTAVYTPPFLAALLLDVAMPYDKLTGHERVLDPACGSGVFLVGAFRRLVNAWRARHQWQKPSVLKDLKSILSGTRSSASK